jgi:transmembrane sensor
LNNNVIKFTDPRKYREEVREQASAWLSRLDRGASSEDLAQLARWMEEDSVHGRMLLNMAMMWDQSAILSELAEIFPLETKQVASRGKRHNGLALLFGLLACIAVLMGGFLGWRKMDAWTAPAYVLQESYETAVGERRQLNLVDGSVVTLNTNTKIRFSFDKQIRDVFLEYGEGFFTVAKDESRPFRVHAGSRVIEAVGTAFTVQHTTGGAELEVLVTEGTVKLLEMAAQDTDVRSAAAQQKTVAESPQVVIDQAIPLVAGDRLTIAAAVQEIERDQLKPDEVEVKLAWRVGMLVFQGEPLETVLQEVGRYTTVKLEADEAIRDIRIDGLFRAGDIDGLLVSMDRNFNVSSQRIGEDQIRFSARTQEE